jgi:hypothetical protein
VGVAFNAGGNGIKKAAEICGLYRLIIHVCTWGLVSPTHVLVASDMLKLRHLSNFTPYTLDPMFCIAFFGTNLSIVGLLNRTSEGFGPSCSFPGLYRGGHLPAIRRRRLLSRPLRGLAHRCLPYPFCSRQENLSARQPSALG